MSLKAEIKEKAAKYRDYTARNLQQIVRIKSLSGEEEPVIRKLEGMCMEAGFDEVKIDGLGNLVGRVGSGPKKLAIDAHIDTVDTGDISQWSFDPFCGEIRDGKVLGRGSVDQKGGAASMITSARILKELGYRENFSIYYTFSIMEEDCDGLCWDYLIEKEGLLPDFAVLTEPTGNSIHRGHRGRMEMEVHCKGRSSHGSAPGRGDNAIYKASRIALEIERLHERLRVDEFLGKGSVAVTSIKSSAPSLCAVPDGCMIHLDRRLTWGETMESALAEVKEVVQKTGQVIVPVYDKSSFKGTVYRRKKYFPTWKIPEDHSLVRAGVETFKELFEESPAIGKWIFSTNAVAICGRHKVPCIGFGPGDEVYAHAPDEAVPVDHLEKASAFYALLPFVLEKTMKQ